MKKKVVENISANSLKNSPRFQSVQSQGLFFILSFTQLIQRGRLADLKNTPSKSRDLWAPPLTTKQKHKTCTKNKMSKKSKKQKKTFQNTAPKPPKKLQPFQENPKNPILLCFMTFVHQLQLLRPPFAAWVSAVLLELRPGKVQGRSNQSYGQVMTWLKA